MKSLLGSKQSEVVVSDDLAMKNLTDQLFRSSGELEICSSASVVPKYPSTRPLLPSKPASSSSTGRDEALLIYNGRYSGLEVFYYPNLLKY